MISCLPTNIIMEPTNMKIAVIADIHGNLEAFTSVYNDIRQQQVESVISLGDNIGYGADSEAVIQQIRKHNIISILGNHELAVMDPNVRKWFREDARQALKQVLENLSEDSKEYIRGLKPNFRMADCLFVHGFPPDSERLYLFQISDLKLLQTFSAMKESICFVGHTHRLRLVYPENGCIHSRALQNEHIQLSWNQKYIVNAGSVGQPRDGDPDAKYLIWDSSTFRLEIRSVPYDIASAAKKIIDAGIPEQFALRLNGIIL
jgi:predicted phosphodiesterase